jgi:hypothetical protein
MAAPRDEADLDPLTGRDVIVEILRNMRDCGEQLYYSTLAPTAFEVHLHPDDFRRLHPAREAIAREARRALDEELARLNREGWLDQVRSRLGVPARPHEVAAAGRWRIELLADSDGTLAAGDVRVVSSLQEDEAPEFEGGKRTQRIFTTTRRRPAGTAEPAEPAPAEPTRPLATLTWNDGGGARSFRMEKPTLVIGRGGAGYWVDVKLDTVPDISREHVRLRHDRATGAFYIKDVSTLGTTVNGEPIPPSIERVGDERHDANVEVALPPRATIGLAGRLFLEFSTEAGR